MTFTPYTEAEKTAFAEKKCPKPSGIAVHKPTGNLFNTSCKKWDCPYCGYVKKSAVRKRAIAGFTSDIMHVLDSAEIPGYTTDDLVDVFDNSNQNGFRRARFTMLTLTEWKGDGSPDIYIAKHFARLRSSLAKNHIKLDKYVRVIELKPLKSEADVEGARVYRHLHVIVNRKFTQYEIDLIRRLWKKATEGTADQIMASSLDRPVEDAIDYALAYIHKGIHGAEGGLGGWMKGERRFTFSRSIPPIPKVKTDEWGFIYQPGGLPPGLKTGPNEFIISPNGSSIPRDVVRWLHEPGSPCVECIRTGKLKSYVECTCDCVFRNRPLIYDAKSDRVVLNDARRYGGVRSESVVDGVSLMLLSLPSEFDF